MRFLIIGLGIYGSNLARDLTEMGHEVIGADNHKANVDAIRDFISTVYLVDATEETSLALLPFNNVDLVIVAIGENFGASIKVVALLKKMKVKHIYARAIDKLHESILEGLAVDRILTPEQRAANDLTNEMSLGTAIQSLAVDENNMVMKFKVPKTFVGLKYSAIDFVKNYKLNIIAVTRMVTVTNVLGIGRPEPEAFDFTAPDAIVMEGDTIVCYGSKKGYQSLSKQINPF